MTSVKLLWRMLLGTLTLVLVTVVMLAVVWVRLSSDENKSCQIQRRGLPADKELAEVMVFSYRLFTDPASADQARRQARPTRRQAKDLAELKLHLGRYAALEAKQPRSRVC